MDCASTKITSREWQEDADTLGVDRTHLYRVITGQRQSMSLKIRYLALKKKPSRKKEIQMISSTLRMNIAVQKVMRETGASFHDAYLRVKRAGVRETANTSETISAVNDGVARRDLIFAIHPCGGAPISVQLNQPSQS